MKEKFQNMDQHQINTAFFNACQQNFEKEAKYLGVIVNQDDIQALLEEITTLRQQVLDTQSALDEISKTVKK